MKVRKLIEFFIGFRLGGEFSVRFVAVIDVFCRLQHKLIVFQARARASILPPQMPFDMYLLLS